jgi:hypothetical protein
MLWKVLAHAGHWKSLYSIMVRAASSGPIAQSSSVIGGMVASSDGINGSRPGYTLQVILPSSVNNGGISVGSTVAVSVGTIASVGVAVGVGGGVKDLILHPERSRIPIKLMNTIRLIDFMVFLSIVNAGHMDQFLV